MLIAVIYRLTGLPICLLNSNLIKTVSDTLRTSRDLEIYSSPEEHRIRRSQIWPKRRDGKRLSYFTARKLARQLTNEQFEIQKRGANQQMNTE